MVACGPVPVPGDGPCSNGIAVPSGIYSPELATDCEVLLGLIDPLNDGEILDWSVENPIDTWLGVEIGGTPTRVTALRLGDLAIEAKIPKSLGQLTGLRVLQLNANDFEGPIPAELATLTELEELSLGQNRLSGEIPPEIDDLTNLMVLDLGENTLIGGVPAAAWRIGRPAGRCCSTTTI